MFDIFPSAQRLRSVRRGLMDSVPPRALWSYPVLREKCACGASTEVVRVSSEHVEQHFGRWRAEHACPVRDAAGERKS